MRLFIDTANVEEIREAASWGVVSGVTTNPSLVAKEGKNFKDVVTEILGIVDGPVSVEAVSEKAEGMVKEAVEFAAWHKNIVVKIPMTEEGLKAVKILAAKGIKTNVTLVFSPNQALLAARAGATFVSPFVGRLDDISHEGMRLVKDIVDIFRLHGLKTQLIAASIRHPVHVAEAARLGADIATVPFAVLKAMFRHPLTDAGIKKFLEDWAKVRK